MNIVVKICCVFITLSLSIFFVTDHYYQRLMGHEVNLARSLSKISVILPDGKHYKEPTFVAGGSGITEERAVIVMYILASLLALSSFLLATKTRLKSGPFKLYVPLAVSSLLIFLCIAYVGYKSGLDYYA